MAYVLIAHQELTSSQASIVFNSIPQTFTDLVLVTSTDSNASSEQVTLISFNDSTTGFTSRRLLGTGSGVQSDSFTTGVFSGTQGVNTPSTLFESTTCYIPNYASNVAKSFSTDHVTEANATTAYQALISGLWNNTAPITKITLTVFGSASYLAGSSASLYGITSGSSGGVVVS